MNLFIFNAYRDEFVGENIHTYLHNFSTLESRWPLRTSSWKAMNKLFFIVNTVAAHNLTTQEANPEGIAGIDPFLP